MRVEASAPSNIALIKYMGKTATASNLPANASLSYTLEHLRTFVTIEPIAGAEDRWQPLPGFAPIHLSEQGRTKFLNHFARLKQAFEIDGAFEIASANNFPSDCGLASSASSFAALTLAAYELAKAQRPGFSRTLSELSKLSRMGSGSSCRSLFSPWSVWRGEGGEACDIPLRLEHAVVIVENEIKAVSSSAAHVQVTSSLLFQGRPERAEARMRTLDQALRAERWDEAFELCWSEFWDMHALFETSRPAFGYMRPQTLALLERLRRVWAETGDGPLVTMDAGPNVHLLLRSDQVAKASAWLDGWTCLTSWGRGQ